MNIKKKRDIKPIEELEENIVKFNKKLLDKRNRGATNIAKLTPFKVLVDLISGIAVGGFLGYILDAYWNTLPIMLFICIIFGMIGGVYNICKDLDAEEKKKEAK
ncbi:MAG: putative F0F1-ATPase subunit Ca2+/Mg2+ transporter [Candidatus Midichloriaceae bacterium]|jgi:F0F1-type ATP synthase assembly protein I|nr:putative F0F1-ATPase subunit Ca2+/Mg2+ transporter [Candidatus Midichloriaceae bacterium]